MRVRNIIHYIITTILVIALAGMLLEHYRILENWALRGINSDTVSSMTLYGLAADHVAELSREEIDEIVTHINKIRILDKRPSPPPLAGNPNPDLLIKLNNGKEFTFKFVTTFDMELIVGDNAYWIGYAEEYPDEEYENARALYLLLNSYLTKYFPDIVWS